jgi:hypothetical protein
MVLETEVSSYLIKLVYDVDTVSAKVIETHGLEQSLACVLEENISYIYRNVHPIVYLHDTKQHEVGTKCRTSH